MDLIYEQAYATIISLASDCASGIPGVTISLRQSQPSIDLHDVRLVSALPPNINNIVSESLWSSRG